MTATAINDADAIRRDRWGRPYITPPDGGTPVPYTRVSTLAKALDDTEGLMRWKCRQTAIGLGQRPDLRALVASCGGNKKQLDQVVGQALDAAASQAAANTGTALHSFTELVDCGGDPDTVPSEHRSHVDAYTAALTAAGITVIACERFIVCDELQAAGTFDRLLLLPDGRIVVGDVKTGADAPKYALAAAIQVAVYARGHLYTSNGDRKPLPGVDTTTGVLIHLPQDADPPRCGLHTLDLTTGWMAALLAYDVRRHRKMQPAAPWPTPPQTTAGF